MCILPASDEYENSIYSQCRQTIGILNIRILFYNQALYLNVGGWWMIVNFFDCSSLLCFLIIKLNYIFSHFLMNITILPWMFLLLYLDWVVISTSPVSSQDFLCSLSRDQSRDVTSRLGVCYSRMILHFAFMHLLSGYYYYDYVIIGVLMLKFSIETPFLCLMWLNLKNKNNNYMWTRRQSSQKIKVLTSN